MTDFKYTYSLALDKVSKQQSLTDLEQFSQAVKKISPEISPFSRKTSVKLEKDLAKAKKIISETFSGQKYMQFDKLNKTLSKAGINLQDINQKILKIRRAESTVGGIASQYKRLSQEVSVAAAMHNRLNKFVGTFKKLVSFKVSIAAYQFITQQFREAVEFTKELDKTLTEIATVSGASRKQLGRYAVEFNHMAEEMGRTTNEMAKASVIFFRQGKQTAEVMELVEATTIAASIAHTEMAQTSEYLTATLNGFKLEAVEAMSVVDKFSAIAANAGTSFEELAIGLTKVASGANNAGIDLDHMMTYIATVSEATRETATNIGTSFKTIIARFRGITSEGHESAATLNSVDKALQSLGISLRGPDGQLRDLQDVLGELGQQWGGLDTNTKAYIATVAAGTRQQNRFIALMENYDRSLEILAISLNSAGAAQAQFGEFSKGIEFSINQLRASLERLWSSLVSSQDIKFLVQGLTKLVKGLTYLGESFSHIALFAIGFNKILTKVFTGMIIGSTDISNLTKKIKVHGGSIKKLTASYKVLSHQRNKMKTDKFAKQVLSASDFERYSTGVRQAGDAYLEASGPLKEATLEMEAFKTKSEEASITVKDFAKNYNKVAKGASLFGKEKQLEGFVGKRAIDPNTLKVNKELLAIKIERRKMTIEEQAYFENDLRKAQASLEIQKEKTELSKEAKRHLADLTKDEQKAKEVLRQEVALQKKKTVELQKQRKAVAHAKLAAIGTLLVVTAIASAIKEGDGTIEDTRDRVLNLTNSLASMALMMSPEPITKAIAAGVLVAGAIVKKFWKTNTEQLKKYRDEIDKIQQDLYVLKEIDESYEKIREKALKGGIEFLDPDEQKQLFDYMQRIANIDKDLIIDFSIDGRPIIDLTRSITELISAQQELVKENKESIAKTIGLGKEWDKNTEYFNMYKNALEKGSSEIPVWLDEMGNPIIATSLEAEDAIKNLEIFYEKYHERNKELLLDSFTFLSAESSEIKNEFVNSWLKIFEGESFQDEFYNTVLDFYGGIQGVLGEAAREGLISKEQADEIVSNTLETFAASTDLTDEQLEFFTIFANSLKNKFIVIAEEALRASVSIDQLLQTYADLEKSTDNLKQAKQKLVDEEGLETEEVLALVNEYGSLIEYLDLTAENSGITAEALNKASDILVQSEIDVARTKLANIEATLKLAEANMVETESIYALIVAQGKTISYSYSSVILNARVAKEKVASLKEEQRNLKTLISMMMNHTLEVDRSTEAQDAWTASIKKSSLEFKNMNELLETSNEELTSLRDEIKGLEEDMQDADLGTVSTLEAHIEAYDKLRGVLEGQLNLQNELKEEALGGLVQVLGILEDDIPGININDIIVDGKVDDTKFNNLVNFAKEQVNKLNEELADDRGTEATLNQVKIYHTLIDEVENYKDAIEKSDIAIDKVNDNLEETREKQQEYYESILINTLTYIEDALKQKFEDAFKDIQEAHEKSVEEIEKERDLWDEILEKQKERLNIEKELRQSEKERRDLLKDIGEKQAEINKLALDDSLFAKKRIKDLTGLVEKDKAKLEDVEYDATFDARMAALDQLDAVKQKDFEKRLGSLEAYLQNQEIKFETLLREGNLERMAAALLRGAKFKVIGDEVIGLNSLITELGEELERTGTRKQLEGFDSFKEKLELTRDILAEIGMTYETVIIDWSQIDSKNLKDFETDIIDAANLVGGSFSTNILDEFKEGTSSLVNEIGLKAEEMTAIIGDHANSIVKIYRGMIVDIAKAVSGLGDEIDKISPKVEAIPSIFDRLYAMADEETRQLLLEAGVINIEAKEVVLSTEKRFPEDKFTEYPIPGGPIIITPPDDKLSPEEIEELKKQGYANGGLVENDGLTFVHGESSPEWIFNSSQLESVIKMTNLNMIKNLASLKLKTPTDNGDVVIQNLINIEGNATEQTVAEIKKLAKQITPYIDKQMVKNIKKR